VSLSCLWQVRQRARGARSPPGGSRKSSTDSLLSAYGKSEAESARERQRWRDRVEQILGQVRRVSGPTGTAALQCARHFDEARRLDEARTLLAQLERRGLVLNEVHCNVISSILRNVPAADRPEGYAGLDELRARAAMGSKGGKGGKGKDGKGKGGKGKDGKGKGGKGNDGKGNDDKGMDGKGKDRKGGKGGKKGH